MSDSKVTLTLDASLGNEEAPKRDPSRWQRIVDGVRDVIGIIRSLATWPIMAVLLVWMFRVPLTNVSDAYAKLVKESDTASAEFAGIRIEASRVVAARAVAQLAQNTEPDTPRDDSENSALVETLMSAKIDGALILWVSDEPQQNLWLERIFRSLGGNVKTVRTVLEAQEELEELSYHMIVTDLNLTRVTVPDNCIVSGTSACEHTIGWGTQLLSDRIAAGLSVATLPPVVFYSRTAMMCECEPELRSLGAYAAVSDPYDLVDAIVQVLDRY